MSHWRLHPDLPIFGIRNGEDNAVYVPGHVMPASPELLTVLKHAWMPDQDGLTVAHDETTSSQLKSAGQAAMQAWKQLFAGGYKPVRLNVQLPYTCNLRCDYCMMRSTNVTSTSPSVLHRDAVHAAAKLIARHCAEEGCPFHLVINGLGEPTLCWEDLHWCVKITRSIAAALGISWTAHLSTNGQLTCDKAEWLGSTFNHVTVACDGPPDIQDVLRPRRDGHPSSACLRATIEAMKRSGATVEVRATVTNANARRLDEIVKYFVHALGVHNIRLELVFACEERRTGMPAAEELAERFLHACATGRDLGANVDFSSPRLTELHSTYCESQRQVLKVMPDGRAANCLFGICTERFYAVRIGDYSEPGQPYEVDPQTAREMIRSASYIPQPCGSCINIYHCSRTCPDRCPNSADLDLYKCRFQQAITEFIVLHSVKQDYQTGIRVNSESLNIENELQTELQALSENLDHRQIMHDTLRAARHYDLRTYTMPEPIWKQKERCIRDEAAQELLWQECAYRKGTMATYLHIPFCRRRCLFCDCHSVVADHAGTAQYVEYVQRIIADLNAWSHHGNITHRRVSTVHFGGGTPDVIGYPLLKTLIQTVANRLAVDTDTEWAIETTAQGCNRELLDLLLSLGFKRLHAGVQTLNNTLRRNIGRKGDAEKVIENLKQAVSSGMVISVDLIYGLPGQTPDSLTSDISKLARIGIHGISLYRLHISENNQAFLHRFPDFRQHPLRDCITLQVAEQCLAKARYVRNHHVHYALPPDRNLYFRHSIRGEDLLALGASASGVMGNIEYVCAPYPDYLHHEPPHPPVTVAVRPMPTTEWQSRLAASLMCGEVSDPKGDLEKSHLFQRWLRACLIKRQPSGYRLTALGAWKLSAMLHEVSTFCSGIQRPESGSLEGS